jgi:hypothetical protein
MPATKILQSGWDVGARLAELGANREELIRIAEKAAAARADSTADDPLAGAGLLSWIYGTRAMRATYRAKGWKRNSADNIPSVVNKETGIKFIFQNADSAADPTRDPKAISEKKVATARLIAAAQLPLFPEFEAPGEEFEDVGATAYYLFVAVDEAGVTAELSSPRAVENNQFCGFHERIFILNKGDLDSVIISDDDDDLGQDFDVIVVSK